MLSKKQLHLLKIIKDNSVDNGSCLLSAPILSELCSTRVKISVSEVEKTVIALVVKGYIDVINTVKGKEPFYCITLTDKGKNYQAEHLEDVREIKFKLMLATVGAVLSFLVGRILFMIFS